MDDHIYQQIEITGSSNAGLQNAIERAVEAAARRVDNTRWFEVTDVRGHIENGRIAHWQTTLKIGFRADV
jgi:dodecin